MDGGFVDGLLIGGVLFGLIGLLVGASIMAALIKEPRR